MSIFTDLRVIASLSRSLRRIADDVEATRIHFGIRSLSELRELQRVAAKEQQEREARDELGRPSPDDFERTEVQLALDELRDRLRRGEYVPDEELISAAEALSDIDGTSDTSNVTY